MTYWWNSWIKYRVTGSVDSGDRFDVIFLDFAKAFDKVMHGWFICVGVGDRWQHLLANVIRW